MQYCRAMGSAGPTAVDGSASHRRGYVTMDDVAREAGVSRALVSLVMRDSPKVSPHRRERVLTAAARLGYRPNAAARNLASHRSRTVGVLLNDLHNPFFAEIANGIEDYASDIGYRLLIITGGRREQREQAMLEALLEYRPDGLILVSPRLAGPQIAADVGSVPCVVIGRRLRDRRIDSRDDRRGARRAARASSTCSGSATSTSPTSTAAGAPAPRPGAPATSRRWRTAGLADRARVVAGEFTEDAGTAAAEELLAAGDAADRRLRGQRPRRDRPHRPARRRTASACPRTSRSSASTTRSSPAFSHIRLTTINQPRQEMGREALQLLLERTDGPDARARRGCTSPARRARDDGAAAMRRAAPRRPASARARCARRWRSPRRAAAEAAAGPRRGAPDVVRVTVATDGLVPEVATGVAAGDGRVLTVAHALSPGRAVRVAGRPARVLRLDRRLDLALLAVPGLRAPALRLGDDARRVGSLVLRGGRRAAGRRPDPPAASGRVPRPAGRPAPDAPGPRARRGDRPGRLRARRCSTAAGACSACSTPARATAPARRGPSTRRRPGRCSPADAGYLTRASACVYRALHVAGEPFSTRTPADRSRFVTIDITSILVGVDLRGRPQQDPRDALRIAGRR